MHAAVSYGPPGPLESAPVNIPVLVTLGPSQCFRPPSALSQGDTLNALIVLGGYPADTYHTFSIKWAGPLLYNTH